MTISRRVGDFVKAARRGKGIGRWHVSEDHRVGVRPHTQHARLAPHDHRLAWSDQRHDDVIASLLLKACIGIVERAEDRQVRADEVGGDCNPLG